MFGKAMFGIAQNLTHRFNLAGGGKLVSLLARIASLILLLLHIHATCQAQFGTPRIRFGFASCSGTLSSDGPPIIGNGYLYVCVSGDGTARCNDQDVSLYHYFSQCHLCTCQNPNFGGDPVTSVPAFKCELFTKVGLYPTCDRPDCGTGGGGGGGNTGGGNTGSHWLSGSPCTSPHPGFALCPGSCYLVPPLGWLLWVEVYPNEPQLNWELKTEGWNEITRQATESDTIVWGGKHFKLYFLSAKEIKVEDTVVDMNMNYFGEWSPRISCSPLPCTPPFTNLLVFRAKEGWMARTAIQKSFTIYLMPYHHAWELYHAGHSCTAINDPWVGRLICPPSCCYWGFSEEWDWTPQPQFGIQQLEVTIAALPVEADAAIDNRPICPDPSLPPTNPRFGTYTYMGGLFVGQVRHWYQGDQSRNRDDDARQTTPDLSGTGRTLLRFYSPTPLQSPVHSAALVLYYTATPYFVHYHNPSQSDAFGAIMLRKVGGNADAVNFWQEETIQWDWLNHFGQLSVEPVTNFHLVVPGDNTLWCLLENPYNPSPGCGWSDKRLQARSSGVDIPTSFVSVVLGANNLSLLPFTPAGQSGAYLNLLVTLANEERGVRLHFPDTDGPLKWYYFLSKDHRFLSEDHPRAQENAHLLPRLWLLWRQR
jgi:hypothetical protein